MPLKIFLPIGLMSHKMSDMSELDLPFTEQHLSNVGLVGSRMSQNASNGALNRRIKWSSDGTELPMIDDHSRGKHEVVGGYIREWVETICSNHRGNSNTITLIDGFCGGGLYRDPFSDNRWAGSPLRLLKAVHDGEAIVRKKRSKPNFKLNVQFVFVDASREHIECLKTTIRNSDYAKYLDRCVFMVKDFSEAYLDCIEIVENRRGHSFFFLDPFGWSDVSINCIRQIMELERTEILFTFMVDFLRRFLSERQGRLSGAFGRLEAAGYYEDVQLNHINAEEMQRYIHNETLRLFREKLAGVLVYPFSVFKKRNLAHHYLLHFSRSPTAYLVIREPLWYADGLQWIFNYKYGITGLIKKPVEYFDDNFNLLMATGNEDECKERLREQIFKNLDYEGCTVRSMIHRTMQDNPARKSFYAPILHGESAIEVYRKGKPTDARHIAEQDYIKLSRQMYLFMNLLSA